MPARPLLLAFALSLALTEHVLATPARIIVLRHGEKLNAYQLCSTGTQRSLALAANYLGKGAANSLFAGGAGPDAFFVITLHTLELGLPAVATWKAPLFMYQVLPQGQSTKAQDTTLDQQTKLAAKDVMTGKQWQGKTIVMIWEHKHISDKHNKHTLYRYLGLDKFKGAQPDPIAWPGENYDFFWDIQYDTKKGTVTSFAQVQQSFPAPFQNVPSNAWGVAPNPPLPADCES